jgi:hypothetical protein
MSHGAIPTDNRIASNVRDGRDNREISKRNIATIESDATHNTMLNRYGYWIAAKSIGDIFHNRILALDISHTETAPASSQKHTFFFDSDEPFARTTALHITQSAIMLVAANVIL